MNGRAGVWIDQEKAVLVRIIGGEERVHIINSEVEGKVRLAGGSRSRTIYGPQDVAKEKKRDERRRHQLHRYYQEVARALGEATTVLIFGPGDAKHQLEREIKKWKEPAYKIAGVEPADKMTEKQIAAKVRGFFAPREGL